MLIKNSKNRIQTFLTALLFFLIPLDYILPHFGSATVITLASIAIIVYGVFYVLLKRKVVSLSHGSSALVLLLIVFMLSYVWAINQNVVFSRFVSAANSILLYILILQFPFDEDSVPFIENASLIGASLLAVYVIFFANLDLVYAGFRLRFSQIGSEYFSDPNGLAGRLMLPLVIAINRLIYSKKKRFFLLYSVLIVAFIYVLLLTGSRAGVIAIALAAIVILFQGLEKKRRWVIIGFFLLLLLFYFAPRFLPEHIVQRVFNQNKYSEAATVEGDRIDIWKHVLTDLFFSSPIFGYGGGCSGYALAQFYGRIKAVHNSYLMVLCEVGLLGFIPWMHFVIKAVKDAFSLRKLSTTLLPATIAVIFVSSTLDAFSEKYLWSIFIYIHLISYCYAKDRSVPAGQSVVPAGPAKDTKIKV